MNEYDKRADDFCKKYGIEFHYTNLGKSFHWNGLARYKYNVRFVRKNRAGDEKEMTLTFWGSNADFTSGNTHISAYDVLSCLSGNDQYKTVDDVISSFGSDLTGIDVEGLLKQAKDMRKFFTPAMLKDLQEIQ